MKATNAISQMLVLAIAAILIATMGAAVAFADELAATSLGNNGGASTLEVQASELSSEYALLKSDGWLYRADSRGNALENGSLWYGPSVMASVHTLFIDSDVESTVKDQASKYSAGSTGTIRYTSGGKLWTDEVRLNASGNGGGLVNLKTLHFKLGENGSNDCGSVYFDGSSVQEVVNFEATNVTTVERHAFFNCSKLVSINLSGATAIESEAFYSCDLRAIEMPEVESIGFGAFNQNRNLATVKLGKCETIDNAAFYMCSSLSSVDFGDALTTLGGGFNSSFEGCTSLTMVDLPATLNAIDDGFERVFYQCPLSRVVLRSSAVVSTIDITWASFDTESLEICVPETLLGEYTKDEPAHNGWYEYRDCFRPMPDISLANVTLLDEQKQRYISDSSVSVEYKGQTLLPGADYKIDVYNDSQVGLAFVTVIGKGIYSGSKMVQFPILREAPMHRLYNPWSGEHFYTASDSERDDVVAAGWTYEGVGWIVPESGDPVYRVYNSYAGEHHYTLDAAERDALVAAGWTDEGVGWYSDSNKAVPLFREYNPYMFSCNHNYTSDAEEHAGLVALGWHDEGIAWYGA